MSKFGIIVSRDGFDVNESTPQDQEFNSEHNSLKIGLEGSSSSTADGTRTIQINHGMGIAPGYLCWYEVDSSGKWWFQFTQENISGKSATITPGTDSSALYIDINTNGSATIKVYYVLFYDPAT
jgi:hypothetical protein